ncbi:MAG: GntR family transcriptional regulator [Desulfobacteraceae bacterium]|nr:GntR family transcriptional regulator [Desulfobacteraceae bacterium]MBU4054008.1 GntR family transcriptional regulator [Pseudomonadota bacterium]
MAPQDKNKVPTFPVEVTRVSKLLRKEIYSGHLQPTEHLKEIKLAETYSVSRMVIRQVLSQLATEGLVVIEPYRGASVAVVTIDQIYEAFSVVAMLEGFSAKLAAENITDEDIKRLSTLLEEQKKIKEGETRTWHSLNSEFHRIINKTSGNPQILQLLRQTTQFTNYWFLSVPKMNFKIAIKAHEKIVAALIARNGDKARKYMEEHIMIRVNHLIDGIKKRIPIGMFRSE